MLVAPTLKIPLFFSACNRGQYGRWAGLRSSHAALQGPIRLTYQVRPPAIPKPPGGATDCRKTNRWASEPADARRWMGENKKTLPDT